MGLEHHISCCAKLCHPRKKPDVFSRSPILNLGDATSTSLLVSLLAVLLACILAMPFPAGFLKPTKDHLLRGFSEMQTKLDKISRF